MTFESYETNGISEGVPNLKIRQGDFVFSLNDKTNVLLVVSPLHLVECS